MRYAVRAKGYNLTYVRNVTDIDDKIIKRAIESNETIDVLTDRMDEAWIEDMIQKRADAKKARDFAECDRIRDELAAQGISLQDGRGG
ncbi:hypothetical protein [Endozoicomonas gorgoniicola]|uniref:hypothetical protein n=1 Tax=Endozoicomonas gorgoniicola TaxID=1234144 RepID=UPI002AD275D3|nr:hypothetical protein [Endozoicomonas gorgoniicola]